MIHPVAASAPELPPVRHAAAWGDKGLLLAHDHGLCSLVCRKSILLTVQLPGQEIAEICATEDTLYLSLHSGLLAAFSLPLGTLKRKTTLPFPVKILPIESRIVAWGNSCVFFLTRHTLDLLETIPFDSPPLRVCLSPQLAVVTQQGLYLLQGQSIQHHLNFPLDAQSGELIDAAPIEKDTWVAVQRNRWSVAKLHQGQLHLEFNACAPAPIQSLLLPTRPSTFCITCDNGQVMHINNNNIQVLDARWPASALQSIIYQREGPTAILSDAAFFGYLNDKIWSWKPLEIPPLSQTTPWLVKQGHRARGNSFSGATYPAPISCFLTNPLVLGLANGAIVDKDGALCPLLAAPITHMARDKHLVAASEHAVAILADLPVIIPVEDQVMGIATIGDTLFVKGREGGDTLGYNLESLEQIKAELPVDPGPAFIWQPWSLLADADAGVDADAPASAPAAALGFSTDTATCLFSAEPSPDTAAAIYTIKCAQGMPLDAAETQLRAMGVPPSSLEDLLILLVGASEPLFSAASSLLQRLLDNKRIEALMQQGGIRPSLVFSALYPALEVKDWLLSSVEQLSAGNTCEKLVALEIIAEHPRLFEFPFRLLGALKIPAALARFIARAGEKDLGHLTATLVSALEVKSFRYFGLAVESIRALAEHSNPRLGIDTPEMLALVGAVSHAVNRSPTGMGAVRKLFAFILKEYPNNILFHKERQLLFLNSKACPQGILGFLWELQNGRQVSLASASASAGSASAGSASAGSASAPFTFSPDGKQIQQGNQKWRLPGGIISLFDSSNVIRPVSA